MNIYIYIFSILNIKLDRIFNTNNLSFKKPFKCFGDGSNREKFINFQNIDKV